MPAGNSAFASNTLAGSAPGGLTIIRNYTRETLIICWCIVSHYYQHSKENKHKEVVGPFRKPHVREKVSSIKIIIIINQP